MRRLYDSLILTHLRRYRQMLFLAGPRQVGKTTSSLSLRDTEQPCYYLNWDIVDHRRLITGDLTSLENALGFRDIQDQLPVIVFDEIHKFRDWKAFLKGFFDLFGQRVKVVVTGSAHLNAYRTGGDSLMGRYFLYRMHPLSVGEVLAPELISEPLRSPIKPPPKLLENLLAFGGFPEPFSLQDKEFSHHWQRLRHKQLFQEDLRDLQQIHEVGLMELLADILRHQAGQLTAYSQLAKKVGVTVNTVKRWLSALEALYYCFAIRPWSKNITRSLIKEPKYYLYDWSLVEDLGARVENLIASHLLKAVQWWSDRGFGDYELYYLRDKDKREVDFLVTKNSKPWFLVESKTTKGNGLSKTLPYFQQQTKAAHAFQVTFQSDYVDRDCWSITDPVIVPASTFLTQLP